MVFIEWDLGAVTDSSRLRMAGAAYTMLFALTEALSDLGNVKLQRRGALPGHMLVLSQAVSRIGLQRCALVELHNGTVGLPGELALALHARRRPATSIEHDPLGFSAGPNYGDFAYGFAQQEVLDRWHGEHHFARDLVLVLKHRPRSLPQPDFAGDYE